MITTAPPAPGFLVSRATRDAFGLSAEWFAADGRLWIPDHAAARRVAERLTPAGHHPVPASDVHALGLIDAALRALVRHHEARHPGTVARAMERAAARFGQAAVDDILRRFLGLFVPAAAENDRTEPDAWANGFTAEGVQRRVAAFADLLLLRVANLNPAMDRHRAWFHEAPLREAGGAVLDELPACFAATGTAPDTGAGESLFELLRAPALASPGSLAGQIRFLLERQGGLIGDELTLRLLRGVDFLHEEAIRDTGPGDSGGCAPVLSFGPGGEEEPERFSEDRDWMPRLVLLAKNTHVWLDQLSRQHGRAIQRLDEIPDEELALLARRGFTGLWLIGVWQRSRASEAIKRRMGDAEAVASAYSLDSYDVAADLGGWEALGRLRHRAWQHGLRLAADMVPNHTGIDSRWVNEHPDWFLSLPAPPFPGYTFHGPDLGSDPNIGIFLEDHYFDHSDASVVFRRVDKRVGEARYLYHGNDGTSMPWNDTAQLNYLLPEVREAVIRTILHVARNFPVIRFDAAMTLAKKHIQRLWFPEPGGGGAIPSRAEHGLTKAEFDRLLPVEFWREVVDRVAAEAPDTLLLAEAFWLMEGYFVRTLGMHRVYNSAFMHMLRDEDNAGYRSVMRNVLEFDPRILQRFVNFMNNPDEKTAVEQFGKGDKYFGICVMLSTLPGLPMFGHGQIEGFAEKYGMEFRRARRDESPDAGFIHHHERIIFPLLHRRRLFAGVENFFLYDAIDPAGHVNEDIFAFSNRLGDGRSLVIYQNRHSHARCTVRMSAGFADGSGIARRSLAEGLGIPGGDLDFVVFRDAITGVEHIRPCRTMAEDGLTLDLGPYQARVFLDWRIVHGEDWRATWEMLGEAGVASVQEARDRLCPPRAPEPAASEAARPLAKARGGPPRGEPASADHKPDTGKPACQPVTDKKGRHGRGRRAKG